MKVKKIFVAAIRKIFIGSFILVSYASIALYSRDTCKDRSIFDTKQTRCKVVNILSTPPNAFLSAALQTRLFLKQLKQELLPLQVVFWLINMKKLIRGLLELNRDSHLTISQAREKCWDIYSYQGQVQYDGTPLVELWDLNYQMKLFSYDLDLDEIAKNLDLKRSSKNKLRAVHPLLLQDGSLVTIAESFVENQDQSLNLIAVVILLT